ncbi:MAG: MFS transporter [Jatrophihabitans sp.]|uniref:MFS transporter n=1 Tax=Jatrophihabitans sp. TaxID=1932789 RepID=UPI00391590CA
MGLPAGTPDGATGSWGPVLAYAALSASNQMLWLTYTPFTTDAARHYGVSSGAIGWLAEIFPLVYVVLAVPAGRLIDRNLPLWLGTGAALTALGGLLRLAGDDYLPVLAGQLLGAVAQPLVLNAVTAVSAGYLREGDRPTGIAASSAGIFAGMVLALVLGAALGSGHLAILLTVQGVLSLVAGIGLCLALRRPPNGSAGAASAVPLRAVWADAYIRRLTGLVCVGFGVFVALTTWLQALLEPVGVSENAAGYLILAMVVAGVASCSVVPPLLARRQWEARFVLTSVLVGASGLVLLAALPGVGTGLAVAIVLGILLLTDLPIVLELAERRAGAAGGTASALVWLAGNAAGLVAALLVQVLVHRPAAAFLLLAGMLLLGLPLLRRPGIGGLRRVS